MVHFCIFGGHEGQLSPGRGIYITVFGGATLKRPPLATRLADLRRQPANPEPRWRYFFFSLFGSATLKWPTLAAEYTALHDALRAGALTLEEWDRSAARAGEAAALRAASFSMFGGLNTDALPSEEEELDDLTWQRHAGSIPHAAVEHLMLAIGQGSSQRLAAVRQAVAATLSAGA